MACRRMEDDARLEGNRSRVGGTGMVWGLRETVGVGGCLKVGALYCIVRVVIDEYFNWSAATKFLCVGGRVNQ